MEKCPIKECRAKENSYCFIRDYLPTQLLATKEEEVDRALLRNKERFDFIRRGKDCLLRESLTHAIMVERTQIERKRNF